MTRLKDAYRRIARALSWYLALFSERTNPGVGYFEKSDLRVSLCISALSAVCFLSGTVLAVLAVKGGGMDDILFGCAVAGINAVSLIMNAKLAYDVKMAAYTKTLDEMTGHFTDDAETAEIKLAAARPDLPFNRRIYEKERKNADEARALLDKWNRLLNGTGFAAKFNTAWNAAAIVHKPAATSQGTTV